MKEFRFISFRLNNTYTMAKRNEMTHTSGKQSKADIRDPPKPRKLDPPVKFLVRNFFAVANSIGVGNGKHISPPKMYSNWPKISICEKKSPTSPGDISGRASPGARHYSRIFSSGNILTHFRIDFLSISSPEIHQ